MISITGRDFHRDITLGGCQAGGRYAQTAAAIVVVISWASRKIPRLTSSFDHASDFVGRGSDGDDHLLPSATKVVIVKISMRRREFKFRIIFSHLDKKSRRG
jgi:hypothetical protein